MSRLALHKLTDLLQDLAWVAALFRHQRRVRGDAVDDAEVVHCGEAAGVLSAAGQRDLELASEVLRVGMAEQYKYLFWIMIGEEAHSNSFIRRA